MENILFFSKFNEFTERSKEVELDGLSHRIFQQHIVMNSLNLMTKKLQAKGFDPRISSLC